MSPYHGPFIHSDIPVATFGEMCLVHSIRRSDPFIRPQEASADCKPYPPGKHLKHLPRNRLSSFLPSTLSQGIGQFIHSSIHHRSCRLLYEPCIAAPIVARSVSSLDSYHLLIAPSYLDTAPSAILLVSLSRMECRPRSPHPTTGFLHWLEQPVVARKINPRPRTAPPYVPLPPGFKLGAASTASPVIPLGTRSPHATTGFLHWLEQPVAICKSKGALRARTASAAVPAPMGFANGLAPLEVTHTVHGAEISDEVVSGRC